MPRNTDQRPVRIQLSRRKGFNLQAHSRALNGLPAVNVARPGRWGNPFDRKGCIEQYGPGIDWRKACHGVFHDMMVDAPWREVIGYPSDDEIRRHLRGKNLACWCPLDQPCHADVLLRIANGDADD